MNSFFLGLVIFMILQLFSYPLAQRLYINDESNRNSNTLPSQSCVVASPASLLCEPKINGIWLEYFYGRECYCPPHSSPNIRLPLEDMYCSYEYARGTNP